MYNARMINKKRVHHTHNYSHNEMPFAFTFDQSTDGPIEGINVLLVCQVTCFKKDGQDLGEVRRLELQGLSLVSGL